MQTIKDYFLPLDELEQQQQKTGQFIEEFDEEKNYPSSQKLKLSEQLFLDNRKILIRKHRRFAHYPPHSHQFLEFNYMLSGSSKQIVNGKEITLTENQVLLLDTNSQHELFPLSENDLLINFLFKTDEVSLDLLKKIDPRSVGLTYNFIMNALLGQNYHENYLVLDIQYNPEIQVTFEQMILEFIDNKHLSNELVNSYAQILFLQLSRVYHSQLPQIYRNIEDADVIISILQMIEKDYRTITLEQLATTLGYNYNYLSNMIKKKTKKTFKQLVIETRLHEAYYLALTTDLPFDQISEYVGFSNKTQFYRKFKEFFQTTPQTVRTMK